jgi:hypothetical protein
MEKPGMETKKPAIAMVALERGIGLRTILLPWQRAVIGGGFPAKGTLDSNDHEVYSINVVKFIP